VFFVRRVQALAGVVGNVNHLQPAMNLAVDGIFGPATIAAVKAVQAFFGIAQDGIVGPHTWERWSLGPRRQAIPSGRAGPGDDQAGPVGRRGFLKAAHDITACERVLNLLDPRDSGPAEAPAARVAALRGDLCMTVPPTMCADHGGRRGLPMLGRTLGTLGLAIA